MHAVMMVRPIFMYPAKFKKKLFDFCSSINWTIFDDWSPFMPSD